MQDYCQTVVNSDWPTYKMGTIFNDYFNNSTGELKSGCKMVSKEWDPIWWDVYYDTKGDFGCNIDPFPQECTQNTYRSMPRCIFTDANPNLDYEGMDGNIGFCGWDPNAPGDPDNPGKPAKYYPNADCMPFIGNCDCPDVDDELTTQCKQKYPQIGCECNPLCKDHMDWIDTHSDNNQKLNQKDLSDIYQNKMNFVENLAAN